MPPPPGYNTNTKGIRNGLTQLPQVKKPEGGPICGGESTGGKTRNGSPASTYIGTMKPRKK